MTSWYLGLSTSGHDPALALVNETGHVVFAEASERFMQDKRAWGIAPDHVSHLASALEQVGFSAAHDRLHVSSSWAGVKADVPVQVSNALLAGADGRWMRGLQQTAQTYAGSTLLRLGISEEMPEVRRFDHHLCHAAAACYSAPYQDATCLVIDGEGEVGAVSLFSMKDRVLKRAWRSWGPGSLGTLYAWITRLCGFDWRLGEEWKVMGLAAFGSPVPALVETLVSMLVVDRGRLQFAGEETLDVARRAVMPFTRLAGEPIMKAADLAASGQAAYGILVDRILEDVLPDSGGNLVLSGGCALNSSYNGTIARRFSVDNVFVPSAPADDGNALGAAILGWMADHSHQAIPQGSGAPFLGSRPNRRTIEKVVTEAGLGQVTSAGEGAAVLVADRLAKGHIIGVMRGGAEFGPRALGQRSILADPRPKAMKDRINRAVKGREAYRPFAPVIPAEQVADWFDGAQASPYMSFTLPWRADVRERVPAVVHEDGTGRLQTVESGSNPWMASLLTEFERQTGLPVVLNTSFNIMGKPIVHTVEDALAVLMTTGLDAVLLEDVLVEKRPDSESALHT
ncbi:carbamoyltransferase family protein [Kordiimonas aestuarii]|uniref:carbamoyltransferase family protein n=1 Tax=Kordiimonas aestuarii TaxID=1005925 RepID=UPI0021D175C1|nr:carbamoyltransferase C-terminal domain-containing protein [Kordiimonas aestuarii]